MNNLKYLLEEYSTPFLCSVVVVFLFWLAIMGAIENEKEWEQFRNERQCKLLEKGVSSVVPITTVTTSGQIAMSTAVTKTPDRYLCNDGVIYQR